LHWVCNENDGQVLITDTHRKRLEDAFIELGADYQIIELQVLPNQISNKR